MWLEWQTIVYVFCIQKNSCYVLYLETTTTFNQFEKSIGDNLTLNRNIFNKGKLGHEQWVVGGNMWAMSPILGNFAWV